MSSLSRNIVTSGINFAVGLGSAFVLLPLMIRGLGAERYGLWMLVSEVTGYYGYLDLGIRAAVTYYTALYLAKGDHEELNSTASTAFWSLSALAGLLALSGWGLARIFPAIFHLSKLDAHEVEQTVMLMALHIGLAISVDVLASILNGYRRLDAANMADIALRVFMAIGTFVCLLQGRGLVALSWVSVAARLMALAWVYIAVRRIAPEVSLSIREVRLSSLRRLARYGVPSLLANLGLQLSARTDLATIGILLDVRMVALYSIPRNLIDYSYQAIRAVAAAFAAHMTHLAAEHREQELFALYRRGSRLCGLAVFLLTASILAFGHDFLLLWQGALFVTGAVTERADIALVILAIGFLPRLASNINVQLLYATNRLPFLAWTNGIGAVVKIVLSVLLMRPWGLAGLALANLIPIFLFDGLAVWVYLGCQFQIWNRAFLGETLVRPLLAGAICYLAAAGLRVAFPPLHWAGFLAEAAIAGVAGLAAAMAIGLTREERAAVLRWNS